MAHCARQSSSNPFPAVPLRIATPRLVLREFNEQDWQDVLAYQQDPRYLRFYPWEDRTEADVRAFVGLFLSWQREEPRRRYQLAVTLRGPGALIGTAGLRQTPEKEWEAEIGYELSPGHWGQGYATEAARAMVAFGFENLGLHRVSSWCIADNAASGRVLERLGMRREGRLRDSEYFKGRWWDTLLFGMLKEEW